jgi:hypothetical protein
MAANGRVWRSYEKVIARRRYVVQLSRFVKIHGSIALSLLKWKCWNLFTTGGKGNIGLCCVSAYV